MNGYLKSLKLTKDFSESILLDYKHEGIYFGANADDMRSRNYNYIVGSRLYQVGILTVDPSMAESEFTNFLKSFKLLK